MSLESMKDFFTARVEGYELHMREDVDSSGRIYTGTAAALDVRPGMRLLDLGCGTGLELDELFARCPNLWVTAIDLCPAMLDELRKKPYAARLTLIEGSYFTVPLGENAFERAVSVESLHHFSPEQKLPLYSRLLRALTPGGLYVETDYAAEDGAEEAFYFSEYARLAPGAEIGAFHYDTPLTAEHTVELLQKAGFSSVSILDRYQSTAMIAAKKAAL